MSVKKQKFAGLQPWRINAKTLKQQLTTQENEANFYVEQSTNCESYDEEGRTQALLRPEIYERLLAWRAKQK